MFPFLLSIHSIVRWALLAWLIYVVVVMLTGYIKNNEFGKKEQNALKFTTMMAHLQLVLGLVLYFISPIVSSFLEAPGASMKVASLRFWGMEHILMMIISITLITIAGAKAKRIGESKNKFKTSLILISISLILILLAIPWSFRGEIGRPLF